MPADVLRIVGPRRLAPLVPEATYARLANLLEHVRFAAQTVCYEARLAPDDDRVDLALCLFPGFDRVDRSCLRSLERRHGGDPAWMRCLQFLERWGQRGAALGAPVPFVWVAFDLDRGVSELPVPCLGVCANTRFFAERLGAPPEPGPSGELEVLARTCYGALHGAEYPERCQSLVARCLAAHARPTHLSFMLGRSPATFKLDVRVPSARVGDLLRAVDFPDDAAAVQRQLDELVPREGHVQLNLVLHPSVAPPLEVELFTAPRESGVCERLALLDRLIALGLCDPEKGEVLRRICNEPLIEGASAIGQSFYFKVRVQNALPTEAKAYVGLMPRQRGRAPFAWRSPAVPGVV